MANTFLTPSVIGREALMLLESNMVFGGLVFRGQETEFTGRKIGDSITIRGPAAFVADEYDGATLVVQDATEASVPMTLEKHFDVSFKVSDKEMTLDIEDFNEQLLQPAMLAIAEAVDGYVADKAREETWSWVGNGGSPADPNSLALYAAIDREMNDRKAPFRTRNHVMAPSARESLLSFASYVEADKRGDQGTALREASMGRFMGLDGFMNQNVKNHTAGSITVTTGITISGAHAAGSKAILVATGAGDAVNLVKGDIISFAGQTRVGSSDFVVTADATIGASTTGTVNIEPGLDVAAAGGEALSQAVTADHRANLAFHPNGIALAVVPLAEPQGAGRAAMIQDRGMSLRVVFDYDRDAKSDVVSIDVLAGAKVQDRRLVTRVLGPTT